jgi:hypothetical protein
MISYNQAAKDSTQSTRARSFTSSMTLSNNLFGRKLDRTVSSTVSSLLLGPRANVPFVKARYVSRSESATPYDRDETEKDVRRVHRLGWAARKGLDEIGEEEEGSEMDEGAADEEATATGKTVMELVVRELDEEEGEEGMLAGMGTEQV